MTNVAVPLAMNAQMGYWPKNAVPNGSWEPPAVLPAKR